MSKKLFTSTIAGVLVLAMASMALAEDGSGRAAGMWIFFGIALACGIGIGIAAFGTGLGMGHAVNGALQGTARNPEAQPKILTLMILGLALIESLCIYAFVISLMLWIKLPDFGPMLEAVVKTFGG